MASVELIYTVVYLLISICLVAPPTEFVSAGLTIQNMFSNILGSEDMNFIYYHIKRTTVTIIFHSLLPLFYYIGLAYTLPDMDLHFPWSPNVNLFWRLFLMMSVILPLCASILAYYWKQRKWKNHPIAKALSVHAAEDSTWNAVASSINIEFRRIDKFTTGITGQRLIVTDSWVMKTSTYAVHVAHQSDVHLSLIGAREHQLSHESQTGAQFLTIKVASLRGRYTPFNIRLNAMEYGDLKEKLQSPVQNARNVVIRQSLSDRFLDAFRQQVNHNHQYRKPVDVEIEACIGCMQTPSNVKLDKHCDDETEGSCANCFCRPMWCLECMGKWFASRQIQNKNDPETWMSKQAPCPTCRATFCMLDVCLVS